MHYLQFDALLHTFVESSVSHIELDFEPISALISAKNAQKNVENIDLMSQNSEKISFLPRSQLNTSLLSLREFVRCISNDFELNYTAKNAKNCEKTLNLLKILYGLVRGALFCSVQVKKKKQFFSNFFFESRLHLNQFL